MAQIKILESYIGRPSNNKRIKPGVYEVGDKCLFGSEEYLIAGGYAEMVDGEPLAAKPPRKPRRKRAQSKQE